MKTMFKFILKKWYLFLIVAASIIAQCYLQLMLPEYMAKIQTMIGKSTTNEILIEGGWMLLIAFGIFALAITQNFGASWLASYVGKEFRKELFSKVNSLSLADYNKFGTATLITRTTNDVEQMKNFVLMASRILVMSPSMMIIALIKTIAVNAKLSLVIACCVPLIIIIMAIIFVKAAPLFKKLQEKLDNVTISLRENLTGIRVIRAYNQEKTQDKKFDAANLDMTKNIKRVGRTMSFAMPAITIIFNICFIAIYGLGFYLGTQYKTFDPEFGNVLATTAEVAQYAMQIMMSFMMFALVFIMLPQASACSKRVNEILVLDDTEGQINHNFDASTLNNENSGTIEFRNVSFKYPDGDENCISNISFKTKKGSTTAIIGSTGSGKSTVINLIPRFFDATDGEIFLDGIDIKTIPHNVVREKVGFVPQQAVLFYGSIKDNIKFGKDDATDEEINEALTVAQAQHFISKQKDGLDTFVSESGKNFSGGQKQRLAIARALVKKPEIYVFDDSFSALDFKTDVKLRTALKAYTKESSVIFVAQRVSSIIDADNIIVLNDGKIVGQGTHNELLQSCETYQDIVKSQMDQEEIEKSIQLAKSSLMEGGAF